MRRGAARFILFAIGLVHRRYQIFTAFGLACGPPTLGIIGPRGFAGGFSSHFIARIAWGSASGLGAAGLAIDNCAIVTGPF